MNTLPRDSKQMFLHKWKQSFPRISQCHKNSPTIEAAVVIHHLTISLFLIGFYINYFYFILFIFLLTLLGQRLSQCRGDHLSSLLFIFNFLQAVHLGHFDHLTLCFALRHTETNTALTLNRAGI